MKMYATLSLASYWQSVAATRNGDGGGTGQEAALFPPPEGPNSAYLVLQEEEEEEDMEPGLGTSLCDRNRVRELPFPQDKCLTVEYARTATAGPNNAPQTYVERDRVYFIPVLGQPISSHSYYVVRAEGKHKGLVETCARGDDVAALWFCGCPNDARPRPVEPGNAYQQIQVVPRKSRFSSRCLAPGGFPPGFLRRKDWRIRAGELRGRHGRLAHVHGENAYLRSRLPPFEGRASPVVTAGEWYCPFIFIAELGGRLGDPKARLTESPFYRMCLEKLWEEVRGVEGEGAAGGGDDFAVEMTAAPEEVLLLGKEAAEVVLEEDGGAWIKGLEKGRDGLRGLRLSRPIVEKIWADQGRLGADTRRGDVRVNRSFGGGGAGKRFACYVAVERYVLRRLDGSVVMTYSFRNFDHVEGKWE